ncbi:MAG: hypothetical protein JWM98_1487 [Thermoleophilia bacterium]|nr:hypothetical protein [Thermoleophilia bacterium]
MAAIAAPSAVDLSSVLPALQAAAAALTTVVQALGAQSGTGAAAGAASIAGGGGIAQVPGQSPSGGCGCGGGMGAVTGATQVGKATPAQSSGGGANAAPDAPSTPAPAAGARKPAAAPKPAPVAAAKPAASSKGQAMVDFAKQQLGKPYVYGATGPGSFDCSGLVDYVAKHFGISVPRTASEQATAGKAVDKADLQPGDLVYFQNTGESTIGHIGIYVGDNKYIHAPQPGENVKIGDLGDSYASKTYRGARRVT